MPSYKWGVCFDFETYGIGLFQTVVQYTADEADERVIIMSPKTMIQVRNPKIRELQAPPQFSYGEKVVPHKNVLYLTRSCGVEMYPVETATWNIIEGDGTEDDPDMLCLQVEFGMGSILLFTAKPCRFTTTGFLPGAA